MPIIEDADLTSVSTDREPFPEGLYHVTVKESELIKADGGGYKGVIIKSRINAAEVEGEPADKFAEREYWHYIYTRQNDGKPNKVGLSDIKRYLEAGFGKGSPEAESAKPDTDLLNGMNLKLYLKVREYDDKNEKDVNGQPVKRRSNDVKQILAA